MTFGSCPSQDAHKKTSWQMAATVADKQFIADIREENKTKIALEKERLTRQTLFQLISNLDDDEVPIFDEDATDDYQRDARKKKEAKYAPNNFLTEQFFLQTGSNSRMNLSTELMIFP